MGAHVSASLQLNAIEHESSSRRKESEEDHDQTDKGDGIPNHSNGGLKPLSLPSKHEGKLPGNGASSVCTAL
jgi:hypothetical protein